MRNLTIKHEYLRKTLNEIMPLSEDELTDELCDRFLKELKYSNLIAAGNVEGNTFNLMTANSILGKFGLLFTDIDEFRKVFPDHEVEAHENLFITYKEMLDKSNLNGFIINFKSEGYPLIKDIADMVDYMPTSLFKTDGAYTSEELNRLKDSINNSSLEAFINNPENKYDYEGLFNQIADSTLLTLMVSQDRLEDDGGMIAMDKDLFSIARLYIDKIGGNYATAYTSEEKISNVSTFPYRYSQIINFAYLINFALSDDLDGVIINPNSENIMLSRDVLLDFCDLIDDKCNNEKLNSGVYCMFMIEGEAY